MKNNTTRIALAVVLVLSMIISLVPLTVFAADEPSTYVLEAKNLETHKDKGDFTDGQELLAGTDNYFTLIMSASTKIDSSNKTFDDGYQSGQRVNFGGKSTTSKNAIKFTTASAAQIKVWWVCGGTGDRTLALWDASGKALSTTDPGVDGTKYITEFSVAAGGTYFIANPVNNNYIFKVEVVEGGSSAPEEPKPEVFPGAELSYDGNLETYTVTPAKTPTSGVNIKYTAASTNTYHNVNAWVKELAAGKASMSFVIRNNGTETVYVTSKLEAAGSVALCEGKSYVEAGKEATVTLKFTGEAEMFFLFVDSGWAETTTSHAGDITVYGVEFKAAEPAPDPTPDPEPKPEPIPDNGLKLTFYPEEGTGYTVDGHNIKYSGLGTGWKPVTAHIDTLAAGKDTFHVTVTNSGSADARVRFDIQGTTWVATGDGSGTDACNVSATGGDIWTDLTWGGSALTVPAGQSVNVVIKFNGEGAQGAVKNLLVYVDTCRGDDKTYNSDITLTDMYFSHTADYSFETKDLEAFDGDKAKGEELAVGTDNFFTLIFQTNSKTQANALGFEDGYYSAQRLSFNGASKVESGTVTRSIKFTTDGPATVTVWWGCGEAGRYLALCTFDGTTLTEVLKAEGSEKGGDYITTFEIPAAGTYYLACPGGNNYFYKVDVDVKPCEHNWADATCTAPKTCTVCGATDGEALGHSFAPATCTAPKTCACGATEGEALGHTYFYNLCLVCYAPNPHFITNSLVVGSNKVVCNEYHLVGDGQNGNHTFPYEFVLLTVTEDGKYSISGDMVGVTIFLTEITTEGADFSTNGASWLLYDITGTAELKAGTYYVGLVYVLGQGEYNVSVEKLHEHSFVEGKCECGESDPNYVPPHEHNFVEGKCECGESDPDYVAPTPDPEQPEPQPEQPSSNLPLWLQKIISVLVGLWNKVLGFFKGLFG